MEILFEDEKYERAFLSGELTSVGVMTIVGTSQRLESVTTLGVAEEITREFVRRFADAPFGEEAADFMHGELRPFLDAYGYLPDDEEGSITYEIKRPLKVAAAKDGAAVILCAEGEAEKYDFSLIDGGADDGECALIVDGTTVLAVAGINDLGREGYAEIYVECAEEYRRRGYAAACVGELAGHLLSEGLGVRYVSAIWNGPSIAFARALGFREIDRFTVFCGVKKSEAEE